MAKKLVEVIECDRCGGGNAHTWLITGPDGGSREIELCDRHAAPIANLFALARPQRLSPGSGRTRPRQAR